MRDLCAIHATKLQIIYKKAENFKILSFFAFIINELTCFAVMNYFFET